MTFLLLCQRLQVNNFLLFVAEVVITSFVSSQELILLLHLPAF